MAIRPQDLIGWSVLGRHSYFDLEFLHELFICDRANMFVQFTWASLYQGLSKLMRQLDSSAGELKRMHSERASWCPISGKSNCWTMSLKINLKEWKGKWGQRCKIRSWVWGPGLKMAEVIMNSQRTQLRRISRWIKRAEGVARPAEGTKVCWIRT